MVPTTTLDDYLLPRMKLKRDDTFEAHMKVLLWLYAYYGAPYGSSLLLRLRLGESHRAKWYCECETAGAPGRMEGQSVPS